MALFLFKASKTGNHGHMDPTEKEQRGLPQEKQKSQKEFRKQK